MPPKRPYFFPLAFTERPSFLPTFTQWPPIFWKFWHFWRNVEKFLAILALKAPFLCISLKDPLFLCTLSLKDPFFWRNLPPKDPYIRGAWWHSYVTFICECPPPPGDILRSEIIPILPSRVLVAIKKLINRTVRFPGGDTAGLIIFLQNRCTQYGTTIIKVCIVRLLSVFLFTETCTTKVTKVVVAQYEL